MKPIRTETLTGEALNYAVALALDKPHILVNHREDWGGPRYDGVWLLGHRFNPAGYWNTAGEIIEEMKIALTPMSNGWYAVIKSPGTTQHEWTGPDPRTAAMRALVARRVGTVVEIPDELK